MMPGAGNTGAHEDRQQGSSTTPTTLPIRNVTVSASAQMRTDEASHLPQSTTQVVLAFGESRQISRSVSVSAQIVQTSDRCVEGKRYSTPQDGEVSFRHTNQEESKMPLTERNFERNNHHNSSNNSTTSAYSSEASHAVCRAQTQTQVLEVTRRVTRSVSAYLPATRSNSFHLSSSTSSSLACQAPVQSQQQEGSRLEGTSNSHFQVPHHSCLLPPVPRNSTSLAPKFRHSTSLAQIARSEGPPPKPARKVTRSASANLQPKTVSFSDQLTKDTASPRASTQCASPRASTQCGTEMLPRSTFSKLLMMEESKGHGTAGTNAPKSSMKDTSRAQMPKHSSSSPTSSFASVSKRPVSAYQSSTSSLTPVPKSSSSSAVANMPKSPNSSMTQLPKSSNSSLSQVPKSSSSSLANMPKCPNSSMIQMPKSPNSSMTQMPKSASVGQAASKSASAHGTSPMRSKLPKSPSASLGQSSSQSGLASGTSRKVPRSATVPQLQSAQAHVGQAQRAQMPDKNFLDSEWWQCCVKKLSEFRCCFKMCYTPTIFGTIAVDKTPAEDKRKQQQQRQSVGPQTLSLAQMFQMAGSGYMGHGHRFTSDQALIFQNGNLLSGSLESLIQHLVPTSDYYPDRTYIFAFLLSSRLFIRPHQLFSKVCQLCVYQQNLSLDSINRESLGKFGPHIVHLISEWTELFPYDFRDERMMQHMRDLTQRIISIYPELRKDISAVMHTLLTKMSKLDAYENSLSKLSSESMQKAQTQAIPTTDIMEVCSSPVVLAQQLTHVELERLSMIGPEEFIQAFCKERIETETTYADLKMTHNLESYVQWFNHLSYVVATEICSHLKKKNRVRMLEYFIDVAKECINIGNFNSLMAIIAGINMSQVSRLKKTWAKVNTAKFDILEHQMDPSSNFGSYRSCLKAAMWRAQCASNDKERVVVPFFSLFVKDLYFLNEGCSNLQPDGNVNFEKCWMLAKQVSDLIAWQQVECPYEKNSRVMHYVQTLPVFSETTLSLASYECEQPENSYDKERHKQLKSQAGL